MSKITRYSGNVVPFANNAQAGELFDFGSESDQNTDLDSLVNASYLRGWGIIGASDFPPLEWFNSQAFTSGQFISYLHQMGVPEWNATQEYPTEGAQVVHSGSTWTRGPDWVLGDEPGVADSTRWKMNSESNEYALYSGTADSIALSTAYASPRKFLKVGDVIRFKATALNTGATTIDLDGLGIVTAKTITGADLPASYIRNDIDTEATYDGSNWVVSRKIEVGVNANGSYTKFENGLILINATFSDGVSNTSAPNYYGSTSGSFFFGLNTKTLPHPLSSINNASGNAFSDLKSTDVTTISTTQATITIAHSSFQTGVSFGYSITGSWY